MGLYNYNFNCASLFCSKSPCVSICFLKFSWLCNRVHHASSLFGDPAAAKTCNWVQNETHQKLEPIQEPDYPDFKLSDLGGILKLYEIVKSEKWFHHANSQTPPCRVPRRIWQHSPLDFEYLWTPPPTTSCLGREKVAKFRDLSQWNKWNKSMALCVRHVGTMSHGSPSESNQIAGTQPQRVNWSRCFFASPPRLRGECTMYQPRDFTSMVVQSRAHLDFTVVKWVKSKCSATTIECIFWWARKFKTDTVTWKNLKDIKASNMKLRDKSSLTNMMSWDDKIVLERIGQTTRLVYKSGNWVWTYLRGDEHWSPFSWYVAGTY